MIKQIAIPMLMASSAFAQPEVEKVKAEMASAMTVLSYRTTLDSTVPGAPYSADETTTTTQTLFDGNRIVNTSTTKVYRDQQGRTRVERTLSNIGNVAAGQPVTNVTITDPVAGLRYVLESSSRTAYKTPTLTQNIDVLARTKKLTDEKQVTAAQRTSTFTFSTNGAAGVMSYKTSARKEDLGGSNMSGVPVQGTRTTTVIPAGAMGNDRDINIVEEHWYSPDLKMNIMTKRSDPRMGETVFQVNNLSRTNPDASLFQVPADYQVKDGEANHFTMGGGTDFKIITKD